MAGARADAAGNTRRSESSIMAKRYKLDDIMPAKRWAEISEDVPPEIWAIGPYREHLRQDLRHIKVMITPIKRKKRKSQK
jgi:hypothetical protein